MKTITDLQGNTLNIWLDFINHIEYIEAYDDMIKTFSKMLRFPDVSVIKEFRKTQDNKLVIAYRTREGKNMTIGVNRFMHKFGFELSKHQINLLKRNILDSVTKVMITDKVCHYYLEDRYKDNCKNLNGSCMRGEEDNYYMKFYEREGVKLIIALDEKDDKICARALLWDALYCIEDDCYYKVMDKIYGSEYGASLLKEFAKENDILFIDDYRHYNFSYKLKQRHYVAPYIDTMYSYDYDENELFSRESDYRFDLQSCCGNETALDGRDPDYDCDDDDYFEW